MLFKFRRGVCVGVLSHKNSLNNIGLNNQSRPTSLRTKKRNEK